jgi:sec-independent protein translocase protein TatC
MARTRPDYPDDIFDNTRMSFGDHIEELRSRLIKALLGLGFCLIIGFILDGIGDYLDRPGFGMGRPAMRIITEPVESQVRNFYARRNASPQAQDKLKGIRRTEPAEVLRIRAKLKKYDGDISELTDEERAMLLGAEKDFPIRVPIEPFEKAFNLKRADPEQTEIELDAKVFPAYISSYGDEGQGYLGTRRYLTTLSTQEAFMVYFKVSLLCGVLLSSPWIFYQMWAFFGAGLYPHERRHIHLYLPFSVGLFLAGAMLCQFVVLPGAVKALLGFNSYVDLDPDLRLNEWLGFAIMLPLVFGISFQTPLVMFFLNRIGLFTAQTYWKKWRYAVFILAIFSAIITPTPDVVTMLYLFVPMFGLYVLGVLICHFFPPRWQTHPEAADESQVAV